MIDLTAINGSPQEKRELAVKLTELLDFDKCSLSDGDILQGLETLKLMSRSKDDYPSVFTMETLNSLSNYAGLGIVVQEGAAMLEALKCMSNIQVADSSLRTQFAASDYCKALGPNIQASSDITHIFLLVRLLFLATITNSDLVSELVQQDFLNVISRVFGH